MRIVAVIAVGLSFAFNELAVAGKEILKTSANVHQQVHEKVRLRPERLRIEHVGGQITVIGVPEGPLQVLMTDVKNLPPKRNVLSFTPALTVVLEEVSPGNYVLKVTAPPGAKTGPTSRPEGSVFFGDGVTIGGDDGVTIGPAAEMGEGVTIGGGAATGGGVRIGRDPKGPPAPTDAAEASLTVFVPVSFLRVLSATTRFGDVLLTDLVFPSVPEDAEPVLTLHGATNAGGVHLVNVRNVKFFGPREGAHFPDGCHVRVVNYGYEETLASLFR